ncbi:unnamed protein product [Soboliphyme baturini]|uniref:Endo/exonuclease/phosphatase domain-containing protein n=1 Tax=Soboliphyme baturini TaxID=241478 RepID=A0A183JA89_9BILA|nr:unnamed protein product [Soboliphyme baturini]
MESLPVLNGGGRQPDAIIARQKKLHDNDTTRVDNTAHAQVGVGVLAEHNLADRIIDSKPISGRVATNFHVEYETIPEEVQCALSEVPNTESLILMGDFNAHVGADAENWNGVTGKNGPSDLNNNGMKLLRFLCKQRIVHY